jgi:dihydrodipicolinate reductase
VAVVIGTSGLTAADFEEIDAAARDRGVGVIAAGNFSLTAAMAQAGALLAARHLPSWEVIDYASAGKPDAPSGTARELAERLGEVLPECTVALLPGCSHFVTEDAPQTVGPLILEFLRSRYLGESHSHGHEAGQVQVYLERPPQELA